MAKPVAASVLDTAVRDGLERAEKLERRLARIVLPILNRATDEAADRFEALATPFAVEESLVPLAAALPPAPVWYADRPLDTPGVTESSCMVALYPRPDQAAAVAEDGGEAPDVIHVTLCYVGPDVTEEDAARIGRKLVAVAAAFPPLEGTVGGVGSFADNGDGYPAIALPDVRGLVELRTAVAEAVLDATGDYARNHGYTPHLTIAYRPDAPQPPAEAILGQPLTFDAIHVVLGNQDAAVLPLTGGELPVTAAAWAAPAGNELVDVDTLTADLRGKTDPVRLAAVKDVMTPALKAAGLNFDVTNPLTAKAIASTGEKIRNIADTTRVNVMRSISGSLEQGLTIPDTAKAIRRGMREANKARAVLIARTELVGATNAGSLAATEIVQGATGVNYRKRWLTSPGAPHPRHVLYPDLNGQERALNETFSVGGHPMQYPGDPAGPAGEVCNCFPADTRVEMPALRSALRRWYDGNLARVRFASGDELAGTPNHPVLRSDGQWVPLGEIREGDHLVHATIVEGVSCEPHPDRPPATISEVYRLACVAADTRRVRARPPDLHGAGADGEIDVVDVDGHLLLDGESASDEQVAKLGLVLASAARLAARGGHRPVHADSRLWDTRPWATARGVRSRSEGAALAVGHRGHPQPVRLGAAAYRQAEFGEPPHDGGPGHAEVAADAEHAVAAAVSLAQVVHVEREPFHGYVFTLDTGHGWFTAGSIVAANCRCTMTYVEAPKETKPTPVEKPPPETVQQIDLPDSDVMMATKLMDGFQRNQRRQGREPSMDMLVEGANEWEKHLRGNAVYEWPTLQKVVLADVENLKSPVFAAAVKKHGQDTAVVIRDNTPDGNPLLPPTRAAMSHRLTENRTTVVTEELTKAKTVGPAQPGDTAAFIRGGLAAALRTEYGRQIWTDMTDKDRADFFASVPSENTVADELTYWASRDAANGDGEGVFAELFSVVSDPLYDPEKWAPWIQQLGNEYFDAPLPAPKAPPPPKPTPKPVAAPTTGTPTAPFRPGDLDSPDAAARMVETARSDQNLQFQYLAHDLPEKGLDATDSFVLQSGANKRYAKNEIAERLAARLEGNEAWERYINPAAAPGARAVISERPLRYVKDGESVKLGDYYWTKKSDGARYVVMEIEPGQGNWSNMGEMEFERDTVVQVVEPPPPGPVVAAPKTKFDPLMYSEQEGSRSQKAVAGLIHNWAGTSSDSEKWALALQRAAADEFGLGDDVYETTLHSVRGMSEVLDDVATIYEQQGDALRAFVRAMYDETQEQLDAAGFGDTIILYRGQGFHKDASPREGFQEMNVTLQPMSSFSSNYDTSVSFVRYGYPDEPMSEIGGMIGVPVPRSRIIGTARSGFGCLNESEFVVLAAPSSVTDTAVVFGARGSSAAIRDQVGEGQELFWARAAIAQGRLPEGTQLAADVNFNEVIEYKGIKYVMQGIDWADRPGQPNRLRVKLADGEVVPPGMELEPIPTSALVRVVPETTAEKIARTLAD